MLYWSLMFFFIALSAGLLAVGIVDGADGRKLKAGEWFHVGQVGSVKIDAMDSGSNETGSNDGCAYYRVKDASPPTKSA